MKNKDRQAQEYAEKVNYPCPDYGWYESDDEQMKECLAQVWLDGYTAAEQSMWRSVEEELPSNDADVLASDENGLHIASYWNGEWYSTDDEFTRQPQMWMPIPSLPDTNTEKI